MISVNNSVSTIAGDRNTVYRSSGTLSSAVICKPKSMIFNPVTSSIYFADSCSGGQVRELNLQFGIITTIAGDYSYINGHIDGPIHLARFDYIQSIALDKAGNIYVSECNIFDHSENSHRIRFINMTSKMVSTISGFDGTCGDINGPPSNATFCTPAGLGVDSMGNVYVAERSTNLVRKIHHS